MRQDEIKQYTHPEEDVFPLSNVQPTSLTRNDGLKMRSLDRYIPPGILLPQNVVGKKPSDLQFPLKLNQTDVKTVDPTNSTGLMMHANPNGDLGHELGLGKAALSLGSEGSNPYLSVYDKWDFDEPGNMVQNRYGIYREMLKRAGTPMHLYSRIPITLDKEGKIPEYISTKGSDINLPPEKQ